MELEEPCTDPAEELMRTEQENCSSSSRRINADQTKQLI